VLPDNTIKAGGRILRARTERELDTADAVAQAQCPPIDEAARASVAKVLLGEILIATGEISRQQLIDALARKQATGRLLGEELIAAGHLQPRRLARALKLQRRLVFGALIAALVPTGTDDAAAGQARAYMSVSATVVDSVSIRAIYQAQNLVVTPGDVARGYVEVPAGSRLEIRNPGPCAFEFRATGELFSSVRISGVDGVAELGPSGGTLLQKPAAGGGAVAVNYRFALAPGIAPGAYGWPLSLTVLPM
jgi:hypothetical protein